VRVGRLGEVEYNREIGISGIGISGIGINGIGISGDYARRWGKDWSMELVTCGVSRWKLAGIWLGHQAAKMCKVVRCVMRLEMSQRTPTVWGNLGARNVPSGLLLEMYISVQNSLVPCGLQKFAVSY
jgi:hypothetical protein